MSEKQYRERITRLDEDIARLHRTSADHQMKAAKLEGEAERLISSITKSATATTASSKRRDAARKIEAAAKERTRAADIDKTAAAKSKDRNRSLENLRRVEDTTQRIEEHAARRRRDEELRHARAVTAAARTTAYRSLAEVTATRPVPRSVTVLMVSSDAQDQERLRLAAEARDITMAIRTSEHRDVIEFKAEWATRPGDLLELLNRHRPTVLHFSGHGNTDAIVFEDDSGDTKLVDYEAFATALNVAGDNLRLVLINACDSEAAARAISLHVEIAIGMTASIDDNAARKFATAFWSAIGYGRSVGEAFEQAVVQLRVLGVPGSNVPILCPRIGIDPSLVVLVQP